MKVIQMMEAINIPKFRWGTTFEHNSGHNRDEWGKNDGEGKSEIKFIVAYTVKGDLAKSNTGGFLRLHQK